MAFLNREQRRAKRAAAKAQSLSRPEREDLRVRTKRALERRKEANKAAHSKRTPAEREAHRVKALDAVSRGKKGSARKALGVPLRRKK